MPATATRAITSRINWLEAKKDYVGDSSLSYAKIAERYGCTTNAVLNRAKKENWIKLRQELVEKASEKAEAKIIDRLAEVDEQDFTISSNLLSLNVTVINEYNKLAKKLAEKPINSTKDYISPFSLNQLTESSVKAINQRRVIVGLPITGVQRIEQKSIVASVSLTPEQLEKIADATNAASRVLASEAN